jgi:hypothetical protein
MIPPATWKMKDFFANCSAQLFDALKVSLKVFTEENHQDAGRRCRALSATKTTGQATVVEADVVITPAFKFPTKETGKKLSGLARISDRYFYVVDSIFGAHFASPYPNFTRCKLLRATAL